MKAAAGLTGRATRGLLGAIALGVMATFFATGEARAAVTPGEEHCVVNIKSGDVLNMRAKPNAGATIVAKKRYGDCGIVVVSCSGSWCRVEDGHFAGWVNKRYIAMVSPALYCVAGVKAGDRLNLRAFPSTGSKVLVRLGRHQCDIAFLPYAKGSWQKIRVDGREGWVGRRYLSGE